MELRDVADVGSDEGHLPSDASLRAMIAFDQLADVEKAAVLASLQLLERDGSPLLSTAQATRLEGPEPLYVLRPAPDVRVLVRAGVGGLVEVLDIIRRAACLGDLDAFATMLGAKQGLSELNGFQAWAATSPE